VCRSLVDSILRADPSADIVVMGDFNDFPSNASVREVLNATDDRSLVTSEDARVLFNCMSRWASDSTHGTYRYRGSWNMLDQFIVSRGLFDSRGYRFHDVEIYNREFLRTRSGTFAGAPYPTYGGNTYLGGYSDHFPILLYLTSSGGEQ
jgi:hypothetical protein